MNAGVSKSGSPEPNPTTSTPAFLRALALALTARVMQSATSFTRTARGIIGHLQFEFVRAENGIGVGGEGQIGGSRRAAPGRPCSINRAAPPPAPPRFPSA